MLVPRQKLLPSQLLKPLLQNQPPSQLPNLLLQNRPLSQLLKPLLQNRPRSQLLKPLLQNQPPSQLPSLLLQSRPLSQLPNLLLQNQPLNLPPNQRRPSLQPLLQPRQRPPLQPHRPAARLHRSHQAPPQPALPKCRWPRRAAAAARRGQGWRHPQPPILPSIGVDLSSPSAIPVPTLPDALVTLVRHPAPGL